MLLVDQNIRRKTAIKYNTIIMAEMVAIGGAIIIKRSIMMMIMLKLIASEPGIPETVNRRVSGDLYTHYNSSSTFTYRDDNNLTYLVSEGRLSGIVRKINS